MVGILSSFGEKEVFGGFCYSLMAAVAYLLVMRTCSSDVTEGSRLCCMKLYSEVC